MKEPPRSPNERLLGLHRHLTLGLRGTLVGLVVLATGFTATRLDWSDEEIRTQLVLLVVAAQLLAAYIVRAERYSFEPGWARNRFLLGAVAGSVAAQVIVMLIPPMRDALGLEALPSASIALAAGGALTVLVVTDAARMVARRQAAS
jgi:Ca2+-transporting ATPase